MLEVLNCEKIKGYIKKANSDIKKYRWCFVAIFIIILLVAFLHRVGFRITYAPELETSWNAVIAFANWGSVFVSLAGAIASFLAVWFAIKVPQQIADRQDKIALFEKRFEIYDVICKCQAFAVGILASETTHENIKSIFARAFYLESEKNFYIDKITVYSFHLNFIQKLSKAQMLFPNEVSEHISLIEIYLIMILDSMLNEENFTEEDKLLNKRNIEKFLDIMENEQYKKMIKLMRKELDIAKLEG